MSGKYGGTAIHFFDRPYKCVYESKFICTGDFY
jgi:hypothetical protein